MSGCGVELTPVVMPSSSNAVPTTVRPSALMATETPNASLRSEFDGLRYASCVQSPPSREKM